MFNRINSRLFYNVYLSKERCYSSKEDAKKSEVLSKYVNSALVALLPPFRLILPSRRQLKMEKYCLRLRQNSSRTFLTRKFCMPSNRTFNSSLTIKRSIPIFLQLINAVITSQQYPHQLIGLEAKLSLMKVLYVPGEGEFVLFQGFGSNLNPTSLS